MGGYGSSRWPAHYRKKATVEASLKLDAAIVLSSEDISRWRVSAGTITWSVGKRQIASADCRSRYVRREPSLVVTCVPPAGDVIDAQIRLIATMSFAKYPRWWFACPRCHRRARCLYLPPGARRWACRSCHKLAYVQGQNSSARYGGQIDPNLPLALKLDKLEARIRKYRYACKARRQLQERYDALLEQLIRNEVRGTPRWATTMS